MIERNAIGFDPILLRGNGNGLYNVDKRMRHINGTISYQKIDNDMVIKIYVPLGSSST
jgi:signal transduction histidine kinase